MIRSKTRRPGPSLFQITTLTVLLGAACLARPGSALAVGADDAVSAKKAISAFDDSLLSAMKDAKSLGYQGRYDKLAPAVDRTFDLSFMTRYLVGPKWNDLSADQQSLLVRSFRNYTVGQYANRFNGYDGETITVTGEPTDQREDVRVATQIKSPTGSLTELDYILHHTDDGLRVIDIFLQGTISQLATQRSQFREVLDKSGPDGLASMLDKKAADESGAGATAEPKP